MNIDAIENSILKARSDIPAALLKAMIDLFEYMLVTKTMRSHCHDVALSMDGEHYIRFPRGVDVKLTEIEFVAEAPMGS